MAAQQKKPNDVVEVVIDLERLNGFHRMGWLHRQATAGGDVFSFEYDNAWLKQPETFTFDPDLQLAQGRTYAPAGRENFGIFLDSSPDRWGRLLMQRRAAHRAGKQGKPAPTLTAWDYLLGVHDITRLGALRFRRSEDTPFLDDDRSQAAPAIASVRELQAISLRLEDEHAEEDPDYDKWLTQLVAPGSSLGGSRPKATVIDETGHLCLAKFPSRRDTHDVGAWEMVVHRLAAKAGIEVAEAREFSFGHEGRTFIVRRFDRTESGGRRAYVSAMTLLQRQDGEPGASYLEIVELLQSRGARARVDCAQLFRRVVFSILVSNTDDHLRNHGFFMEPQGLVLSPAFDMNPNPERSELSLAIDEVDATCDPQIALRAASSYGLAAPEAVAIFKEVQASVATWRDEAAKLDLPRGEQQRLSAAFR